MGTADGSDKTIAAASLNHGAGVCEGVGLSIQPGGLSIWNAQDLEEVWRRG